MKFYLPDPNPTPPAWDILGTSLLCRLLPPPLFCPILSSAGCQAVFGICGFFSLFLHLAVTSQVSSQEEQLGQVAGGLPARKQALPPSLVFKKLLPCCLVPGLSIPLPLCGCGWQSHILQQRSGHIPGSTRHHCACTKGRHL